MHMGRLCCRKNSSCLYALEYSQHNCFDSVLRFSPGRTCILESRLTSPVSCSQGYISLCTKAGLGSLKPTYFWGQFPLHMAPYTHICLSGSLESQSDSTNWLSMSPRTHKDSTHRILTQNPSSNCVNGLWVDQGERVLLSTHKICFGECRRSTSLWQVYLNSSMLLHRVLYWAFPFAFL